MARIYEVRYRKEPGPSGIVAHQHETENGAKIDAKSVSKAHGACMLGEIETTNNHMIRAVQFAGGVMGKWANRSDAINPCRILLMVDDTRIAEPTGIEVRAKEYTEAELAERKAALQQIRDAQNKSEKPKPSKAQTATIPDKKEKLIQSGMDEKLVDIICKSGVHIDSPNYNALVALYKGTVTIKDFPTLSQKELNALMTKLRSSLMSNQTGKSIANKTIGNTIVFKLVDFVMEVEEID